MINRDKAGMIIPPTDFPKKEHYDVQMRLRPVSLTNSELYKQFASSWNAVSYRYIALDEYEQEFHQSLTSGKNLGSVERYIQEKSLFGFFSNGFSCVESIYYSLYTIGGALSLSDFPLNQPKIITPAYVVTKFATMFSGDPINDVISNILKDPAYLEWKEIRNILNHRIVPGRNFSVSIGGAPEVTREDTWQLNDIAINQNMTASRRVELAKLIHAVLTAINAFTESRFS